MKIINFIAYLYHKFYRFLYRKDGKYQSSKFEYHHRKMKNIKGDKMNIEVKIEEVMYERDTKEKGTTSNVEEAIKICSSIDGDYNVHVYINGEFSDVYKDIEENEIRELFK